MESVLQTALTKGAIVDTIFLSQLKSRSLYSLTFVYTDETKVIYFCFIVSFFWLIWRKLPSLQRHVSKLLQRALLAKKLVPLSNTHSLHLSSPRLTISWEQHHGFYDIHWRFIILQNQAVIENGQWSNRSSRWRGGGGGGVILEINVARFAPASTTLLILLWTSCTYRLSTSFSYQSQL